MDRDKLVAGMLTEVSPALPANQVDVIKSALKAFSDKQLTRMDDAGVRMWPFVKGLPPDIAQVQIDDLGAPAELRSVPLRASCSTVEPPKQNPIPPSRAASTSGR